MEHGQAQICYTDLYRQPLLRLGRPYYFLREIIITSSVTSSSELMMIRFIAADIDIEEACVTSAAADVGRHEQRAFSFFSIDYFRATQL